MEHELAQTDAMSAKSLYGKDYNDRDCKYMQIKMKCVATCPSEVVHESKLAKETCNIGLTTTTNFVTRQAAVANSAAELATLG